MQRSIKNFASVVLLLVIALVASGVAARQASQPPGGTPPTIPPQIKLSTMKWHVFRALIDVSDEEYAYAHIGIDTDTKRVWIDWIAEKTGASRTVERSLEALSFWPTACCRSRLDPRAFYVCGRSTTGPVIELWKFNADETLSSFQHQPSGRWMSTFSRPTIDKSSFAAPAALGNVADMTAVTPAPGLTAGEELWVMEWESRNVYAVSSVVAGLTVRVPAAIAQSYRSLNGRSHSTFGSVVILDRRPWQINLIGWAHHVRVDPSLDTDRFVAQDIDLDGLMEGSFQILKPEYGTHALYSTGQFTDDD